MVNHKVKVLTKTQVKFTVNKCDYCHKPILKYIHYETFGLFPETKYFCCEDCKINYNL